MLVRAYFILGGEPGSVGLVPVLREVPKSTAVAKAAMTALLGGPTKLESGDRQISTAIPDGTTLLGVSAKNGVATVNLSTEYDSGGGSDSMQYRLAAGRLHADPVRDHQVGRVPDRRRDRDGVRQRGHRPRRPGRPGRLLRPASGDLRRPAGVPGRVRVGWPRQRQRRRVRGDLPGHDPRRGRHAARRRPGHGQLRDRMPWDVQHDPRATRSARASGARCARTSPQPKTGHPRISASIPSG